MRVARSNFVLSVAASVAMSGGASAVASDFAHDQPERLPPFWVEAEPVTGAEATERPFVLSSDAFSGRAILTLKDALAAAPGVLLQESFGGFEPPRLSIRGSGLQSAPSSRGVTFLLDGSPLNLADGSFNGALIDPRLFNRVELFRGDAALALAPAVLGGALNLRTTEHVDPPSEANVRVASFGHFGAAMSGGGISGHATLQGAASIAHQDGYREHSAQRRGVFAGTLRFVAPTGCEAAVSVYHARADYDVPGPLTLAAAQQTPRSTSDEVKRDRPNRDARLTQIAARFSQQNDVLALKAGCSWLRTSDRFQQLRGNGINDSQSDDLTLRGTVTRRLETATVDHFIAVNASVSRGWRDLTRFRNDSGTRGPRFGDDGLLATTASLRIDVTTRFSEKITVTTGVGELWAHRAVSDRFPTAPGIPRTDLSLQSKAMSPRARVTWTNSPHVTVHASVSRAHEPPTFDDLVVVGGTYPTLNRNSQRLASQRATTWEVGTARVHGAFGWDLTLYSAAWRNEILRLADANGLPRGAVNAGPTRHRGLELLAHWNIIDRGQRLTAMVTAACNDFTFVNNPLFGSNRLAGTPRNQGSATLRYEHPRGLFLEPSLEWIAGPPLVDHAGRLSYGGHTLTHVRAGWKTAKTWTFFAEVKNVFDHPHIASTAGILDVARNPATTAIFLPGVARTFALGLEWRH